MSLYAYLCLDAKGIEQRGELDALNESDARRTLREGGLKVLTLAETRPGSARSPFKAFTQGLAGLRRIRDADRALFYRQMSLMLKTGHTLNEALSAAGKFTSKPRMTRATAQIADDIRRGNPFSAAANKEKTLFNRLTLKLVEAGEASGELGIIFDRMAAMIERKTEVRRQLVNAMVYPGILICASIVVVYFLVTSVIPRLATFFAGRGKAVPWAAQTLLDIADWFSQWGTALASSVAITCLALLLLRRIPGFQQHIDRAVIAIPVIGGALAAAAMAQATWLFGILIKSRLTALEALRICAQSSNNTFYAAAFTSAATSVLQGKSLAVATNLPAFPILMRHMTAAGERSGQIETVMESLGTHYQRALDARVKLLASMFEPILTLLIGVVVGFVYFAFFQAILTASTGG
ncbi:MAG: type II secretion system F family protein [Azoarcus sp.]|nr:type II secretion system F family protein [Azoarcus sp.]